MRNLSNRSPHRVLSLAWLFMSSFFVHTAFGQGLETFDNLTLGASYVDGSFTGLDNRAWYYYHARNPGDFPIEDNGIMLRNLARGSRIVSDPIPGGIGDFSVQLRKAFTSAESRQAELFVNGISRGVSEAFGAESGTNDTVYTFSVSDINIPGSVVIEIQNIQGTTADAQRQFTLDNITWTGYTPDTPWLEVTPFSITGLDYFLGEGPSAAKSYSVSGFNLDGSGNITVTAPEDFEIATSSGGTFHESLALPFAGGIITGQPLTIYARLAVGHPGGNYSGSITHTGGGLNEPPSVQLAGEVGDIILLTGGTYTENFNNLGNGLPRGVRVVTGATTNSPGTDAEFSASQNTWGNTTGAFKNLASAEGLTSTASTTDQNNSTNRALGIRTTASFGDPGAAFIIAIDNTRGYTDINVSMDLMMLSVQGYSQTWTVDYRVGTSGDFTVLGTWPDPGEWGTTPFAAALGSDADNSHEPVEIRVAALSAATGSGSRDTIAIDNLILTATIIPKPTVILLF